jgi:hypothetical protein
MATSPLPWTKRLAVSEKQELTSAHPYMGIGAFCVEPDYPLGAISAEKVAMRANKMPNKRLMRNGRKKISLF